MSVDEHPLDGPLGDIHQIAIVLEMTGYSNMALRLAAAHEKIQAYLLAEMEEK